MKKEITITLDGNPITAAGGLTLSEIIKGEKPCGGHGKCGKCKVFVKGAISEPSEAERNLLSAEDLARGVRLACLTLALGDCEIGSISPQKKTQIVTQGTMPEFNLSPTFSDWGIAMDIGTTTIAAKLYDAHGNLLCEASCLNPQSQWGADVISRIEAALDGKAELLAQAIREALNSIISELTATGDAKRVDRVVITGNTVMLSLLTRQSVEPFSHAPFHLERAFGETLTADELSLSALLPNTPVYLPPCISAFVGADITCALLATNLCKTQTALLADIGTNGEMALWHNGKLTVCSTAAGPAFEGVGISMGMRGVDGAIDKVIVDDGQLIVHVIGDGTPTGICGSGLVDAVACMLQMGLIDESGFLEDEPFVVKNPVVLTQKDIRMLQLAKSAICAGLLTLMDAYKLQSPDVPVLYIAGGFGNYLNKESAAKIGLLPTKLAVNSHTVGNAALSGAAMLLLSSGMRVAAQSIVQHANVLDLSTNPTFSEHYMMGMVFEDI